jgi:hypothetical protein
MMAQSERDEIKKALCAVQSELPPSAEVRCDNGAIERRAYEIYESKGRPHGSALDHWLEAEREWLDNHR